MKNLVPEWLMFETCLGSTTTSAQNSSRLWPMPPLSRTTPVGLNSMATWRLHFFFKELTVPGGLTTILCKACKVNHFL